jgi:hypothetical protein
MAEYVGTSAATKPTDASVPTGSKYWESDTDKIYEWDGDSWVLKSIGGAGLVTTSVGSITHVREQQNLDATAVTFDFSATPIRGMTVISINDGTTTEEYNSAVIVIDPPNAAVRDAWLAETGDVAVDTQRIPIVANGQPQEFVFTSDVSYIGAKHELGTENEIRLFVIGVEA